MITELIGRFHPLFIHMPIGILLFGAFLHFLPSKNNQYLHATKMAFMVGSLTAIASCLSGYFLYKGEGYSYDTIKEHLWVAIGTTVFSLLLVVRWSESKHRMVEALKRIPKNLYLITLVLAVSATGHLGGNITHGSDFLIEPLPQNIKALLGYSEPEIKEIVVSEEDWENTLVYPNIIEPIFANKCYSCHGAKQDKGGLQLHTHEAIMQGGDEGEVLVAGNTEESRLYQYLILPKDDEKHMPPKEKTQLTKSEIAIIEAWIANHASFEQKASELNIDKTLLEPFFFKAEHPYPDFDLDTPDQELLDHIKSLGFHIEKVSKNLNFVEVSAVSFDMAADTDVSELETIAPYIVRLNLSGTKISDDVFEMISGMEHLTNLDLSHTEITGNGIAQLSSCKNLISLNLNTTRFSESHLEELEKISSLKHVTLYGTPLKDKSGTETKGEMVLEYGGYLLPKLASDTVIY